MLTVLMGVVLVAIAYFGAYLVRWDTEQIPAEFAYFRQTLAMVIVLKLMGLAARRGLCPPFPSLQSRGRLGDDPGQRPRSCSWSFEWGCHGAC